MSEEALDGLRKAFVDLLVADRRLRGREGQRPGGMSLAHMRLLSCLLDAEGERLSAGRLAAAAELTPASATQMLDGLERRGVVVRERDAGDRRVVVIALTEEGRRLVLDKRAEFRGLWAERMGDLGEDELRAGLEVLGRLHHFLEEVAERKRAAEGDEAGPGATAPTLAA
jgi:DNA-binding MarR family transcriptional regulator